MWLRDILRIRKLRRDHDRLYALCGKLEQQLKNANREAADLQARNDLFAKCLRRANKLWKEAHPESRMWPDGAKNIVWLLEQLETYRAAFTQTMDALKCGQAIHASTVILPGEWEKLNELYDDATHVERKGC